MTRKRNHRMRCRGANVYALENVLHNSAPPDARAVGVQMTALHMAYESLKTGKGTEDDVVSLGIMLNVGAVRSRSIGAALGKAFEDAGAALQHCERLKEQHGRYGFTGPGLLSMNAALELYSELLAMSSPNQMSAAKHQALAELQAAQRA